VTAVVWYHPLKKHAVLDGVRSVAGTSSYIITLQLTYHTLAR